MVTKFKSLTACAAVALAASRVPASVLLSDGFDQYADQSSFVAAWPISSGASDTLGAKDANVMPTDKYVAGGTSAGTSNSRTFDATRSGAGTLAFSFDFYDSSSTAAPYKQWASVQDGTSTGAGQLVSIGLNNTLAAENDGGNYYMARISGFTPTYDSTTGKTANPATSSGAFFKLNDAVGSLRSTGWHNLEVEIRNALVGSTNTSTFKFYVDGTLSETKSFVAVSSTYQTIRLGSGNSALNVGGYDNVLVNLVAAPEPFGLGALVLSGVLLRRRRRHA